MKTNKTFSLSIKLAKRLDDEPNQSELVESLLREHYGMEKQR